MTPTPAGFHKAAQDFQAARQKAAIQEILARLNKTYDFSTDNIVIPTDAARIEYGMHRVQSMCIGCHGTDLSGIKDFAVVGPIMTLDFANLTSSQGGIGQEYTTDEDYVRAMRHGVGPDGKPIFMPAVTSLQYLSDEDLDATLPT